MKKGRGGSAADWVVVIFLIIVMVYAVSIALISSGIMLGNTVYGVQAGTGTLKVSVVDDASGAVVSNAVVYLRNGSSSYAATFSSPFYQFTNIPAGSYIFGVDAAGYVNSLQGYVLAEGNSPDLPIRMVRPVPDLYARWQFSETTWASDNTAAVKPFYTASAHYGSAKGGATTTGQGVYGRSGSFDGVDDYVEVPNYNAQPGVPATVMFWLRVNPGDFQNAGIFGVGAGNATDRFSGFLLPDKRLLWDYGEPLDSTGRISVDYTPHYGNWTHVAFVSGGKGGIVKAIYLNGNLAASAVSSDGFNSLLTPMILGAARDNGNLVHLRGLLDEISIYTRAFTGDEIRQAYLQQLPNLTVTRTTGPVTHWTFDEIPAGTEAVKDAVDGIGGTAKNGLARGSGKIGGAASFDGIDDEFIISSSATLVSFRGPFSVAGWFKTHNLTAGDVTLSWVSKRDAYAFGPNKDGSVSLWACLSADGAACSASNWIEARTAPNAVKEGMWQQWSGVYNGAHLVVFLNGSEVKSVPAAGLMPVSRDLYIGHDYTGGAEKRYFNGSIDELQFYDRGLSAAETDALFKAQLAQAAAAPVAATPLSACGTISQSGSYVLTRSATSGGTCITIAADAVTLDGQGNSIGVAAGNPLNPASIGNSLGILVRDRSNVTVKNVLVEGFTTGILLHRAHSAILDGVVITQSELQGLYLDDSRDVRMIGGAVDNTLGTGILFERTNATLMNRVAVRSNGDYGVFFALSSMNNVLSNMYFANNSLADVANDSTSMNNAVTRATSSSEQKTTLLVIQPDKLAKGHAATLGVGESVHFKVGTATHNLTVASFAAGVVTVVIRSTPVTVTLSLSETKQVDMNGNGKADLNVTFSNVVNGNPVITLKTITEQAPGGGGPGSGPGGVGGVPGQDNDLTVKSNVTNKTSLGNKFGQNWDTKTMIIVIVALIVFIIFVVIAIVLAVKHQNTAQNNEFYRPEPRSSTLQPGGYDPGASM